MSNLYIHNGNEWCDVCSNTAKIKVPSGDWVQIGKGSEINKYYNGTEWVILECPNECPDITIGTQIWTSCNLNVSTYRNGDIIPQVQDPTEWANLTTGAWCYYDNDPSTEATYGKLYNWHAVNDSRGLSPDGYHIPTDCEVATLSTYLGGDLVAGAAMKETGTTHWVAPNNATNSSGFIALPAGWRIDGGSFSNAGYATRWWTFTEINDSEAGTYDLYYTDPNLFRLYYGKNWGHSVRLVKGDTPACPDITIGTQIWTGCNLNVETYRNGDIIPQVQDPTVWNSLTTPAWCYYNNDPANGVIYGKLYNWYAINDPRGIAPDGYHVPTDAEWTTLIDYIGGDIVAGGKLKETGTTHWIAPNTDATNEFCFTGLPGGDRIYLGYSDGIGNYGGWWSSSEFDTTTAWSRYLNDNNGNADRDYYTKKDGLSIRLVKGEAPNPDPCPDCISGDITIGTQVWAQCNLNVTTYRNGDVIPEVTDPTAWTALTTGAWCWYNNDSANDPTYGKLYNWHAVNDTLHGGLAPVGYHVPTKTELTTLTDYLGGSTVAGGKMKEVGLCHWTNPNIDATNTSLFTGLPGGGRDSDGAYQTIGDVGNLWSSTNDLTSGPSGAWYRRLTSNSGSAFSNYVYKECGFSVRVIKD